MASQDWFRSRVKLFVIDEAHNTYRWGLNRGDIPAFRPAWRELGAARIRLFSSARVLALTATAPPRTLDTIISSLHLHPQNHTVFRMPLNRPNICYVARTLKYPISDMRNYSFFIPTPDHTPASTIIFCDEIELVMNISSYLNSRLSNILAAKKLVRAYHGKYSDEYRKLTWSAYKTGECRILVATSSAGTVSIFSRTLDPLCSADAFLSGL